MTTNRNPLSDFYGDYTDSDMMQDIAQVSSEDENIDALLAEFGIETVEDDTEIDSEILEEILADFDSE